MKNTNNNITTVESKNISILSGYHNKEEVANEGEELTGEIVEAESGVELTVLPETLSNAVVPFNQNMIQAKSARANSLKLELCKYQNDDVAEEMTNNLLDNGLLDSRMLVATVDGEEEYIAFLIPKHTNIDIVDMVTQDEEGATGELSHNNYFDAVYKTTLRGGEEYKVVFGLNEVQGLLTHISVYHQLVNQKFLLKALVDNIAISDMPNSDITKVIEKLISINFLEPANDFRAAIKKAKWRNKRFSNKVAEHELEALYLLQGYALLNDKGSVKFIDLNADSYQTITKANLMLLFANQQIEVMDENSGKVKMVNPVILYLESRHRKEYAGVAFDPSNKLDPSIYNLFRGYKIEAKEGAYRITKFKEFVRTIICSANELTFNIVWSFFAQIIQKPWEKTGIALIMLSIEGSGKGLLMEVMGNLMGSYYMSSTDHKHIVSPFNKHLEQTLLYYANEAKFTDSSFTANKLKNIITETAATTEVKNGSTYATNNYTHLVIDGNDGMPVEHNEHSRRFFTVYVDESKVGDLDYYDEIIKERNSEMFYEAMMYEMMTFDYSEWEDHLRRPPKPVVTDEQIQESFDAVDAWWAYCLENARIPYVTYDLTPDDKLNILNEDMFQSFKKWCSANGYKHSFNASTFGKTFREQALGRDGDLDQKGKITINGERKHSHVYAKISACRESFSTRKRLNNMEYNSSEWKLPLVN